MIMPKLLKRRAGNTGKRILTTSAAALLVFALPATNAAIISQWTFESPNTPLDVMNVTTYPNAIAPSTGTGNASAFHASNLTDYSTPVGNGSADSFSSNTWAVGDYYQFSLSTTGFQDITLNFDQTRSGTGPTGFTINYSTDGTSFTSFNSYTVNEVGWSAGTPQAGSVFSFDLSSVSALVNASTIFFRLSATAVGAAGGTSRIDNFTINGNTYLPPAPLQYWNPTGSTTTVGGTGIWDNAGLLWNPSSTGAGAQALHDSTKKAVFAGNAGEVTIGTGGVTVQGGIEFQVDGYTVKSNVVADKLTLGTNSSVNVVNAADTATISASVTGTNGLNKLGPGKLVLSGDNDFTGNLQISAGTLVVSSDVNFGDDTAGLVLNSGTLATTGSITLGPGHSVTGSGGTLDIAPGSILDITGSFNTGAITLSNSGSLFLTGPSATITALTFEKGSTLFLGSTLSLAGPVVATHTSGTATIDGSVNAGTSTRQWTIADGSADVDFRVTAPITLTGGGASGNKIQKLGPGTLEALGEQSTMGGWRLGNAGSSPATSAVGGELRINDYNGLGNNQFQFNDGTLNVTGGVDLVGDGINAIPSGVSLSLGAGQTGVGSDGNTLLGAASFKGANIEFMGPASLFEGVAAAGAYKNHITVANSLILSGGLNDAGGTAPNLGSDSDQHSTGLLIDGPGAVVFNNAVNSFGVENDPNNAEAAKTITVSQATLAIDGNLTAAVKPGIEVIGDGKLQADTGTGLGEGLGSLNIIDGVFAPGITGIAGLSTDQPIADVQATSFTLGADGEFKLDLSTGVLGGYDQLIVTGTTAISLAGTLSLSLAPGYTFTVGQVLFPIVNSTGMAISGTFAGLAQGQTILVNEVEFIVGYGGDSVGGTFSGGDDFALFVNVPEPSSAALLAAACATLGLGRIRRRRA